MPCFKFFVREPHYYIEGNKFNLETNWAANPTCMEAAFCMPSPMISFQLLRAIFSTCKWNEPQCIIFL